MAREPRFNATIWEGHHTLVDVVWPKLKRGEPLTGDDLAEVGNFFGMAHDWHDKQNEFVPVGYRRDGANFALDSALPVPTTIIDVPWGDGRRVELKAFGCNAVAMRFTVPANAVSFAASGYVSIAEYQGPPTLRQATLSTIAGDFGPGVIDSIVGVEALLRFNLGGTGPMGLQPGRTYYFNFRNFDPASGQCTCPIESCNASFSTNWPH